MQIDFEHRVAIALLKLRQSGVERVVLEDESPNIGSVHIPHPLYERMREAPSVVLEAPLEVRVDITLREYVVDMLQEYCRCEGDAERGFVAFSEYLRSSLARIRRRLGGLAHAELLALLDKALQEQQASGEVNAHREWLRRLLVDYYDPMYDYQQQKRGRRILHRGDFAGLLAFLRIENEQKAALESAIGRS